jgi:2-oxo-4-hydroxy-4-carboxy-5-ureidoimidazoline decarboxylase
MNEVLARWNHSSPAEAAEELLPCCGSPAWAKQLAGRRPFPDTSSLLIASDGVWLSLPRSDWLQAFHSHPRIGEASAKVPVAARSSAWSQQEQRQAAAALDSTKQQLAKANRAYEQKFGHIFIVCATGKSAVEILEILRRRMHNDADTELREAAEQQRQITQLRLKKWLVL